MKRSTPGLDALGHALMKSGLYRTGGLVVVFAASLAVMLVRRASFDADQQAAFTAGPIALTAMLLWYESAVVVLVRRAIRLDRRMSARFWIINAVVECSLPTAAVAVVWWTGTLPGSQALIAPAIFAYGFFIVLSILHVRPWLTVVTSGLCFIQYLMLMLFARGQGVLDASPENLPAATMMMYPVMVAMTGVCAVFVSVRVRQYVETAVSEGELREHAEREIRAASRVQHGVLPTSAPNLAGFTIAGWTRPARDAGGDYYDWAEHGSGQVVASIADVAGHGLGPALITAYCRAYARCTIETAGSLGQALTRINALVSRDLPAGRFVTFATVRLTADSNAVALLSAGHGPILHYRMSSNSVDALEADDLPLGVVPDLQFCEERTITMVPGDVLVLVTDGFFEWLDSEGESWGVARLRETVLRAADQGPEAIIDALVRNVEAFARGAPQLDDLTVVVIGRDGRGRGVSA